MLSDKKCSIFTLLTAILLYLCAYSAQASIPVSRYQSVAELAPLNQRHLLQQTVQLTFPAQVLTVGDALHYLLRPSGYQLGTGQGSSGLILEVLQQPLPVVHRQLGPITLKAGLQLLLGDAVTIQQDKLIRQLVLTLNEDGGIDEDC